MKFNPYPKYKDSGIQWIGEIPEGWEVHRLKSFITSIKNGQWGKEPQGDVKDFFVLRVADFSYLYFNLDKDLTVRNISDTKLKLSEGDLVIEKSGGGEKQLVGRVIQVKGIDKNGKFTFSNFIGKLTIKNSMSKDFLNYYFKAFYSNGINFNYIKQTTGIQNLDVNLLVQNEFFGFPTNKQDQTAIANFLDKKTAKIDAMIEKDKKLIELLKERRTALINHAVTKGLDPNVKLKDSGVEWIGEIPEGWDIFRLKIIANIKYGLGQPPQELDSGLPIIRATNIERGKINKNNLLMIDPRDVPYDRKPVLKENDIIVVRSGAYTGDSAIITKEFEGSITGYDMVVSVIQGDPKFTSYCLLSNYVLKNQIDLCKLRAAQPHLNAEELGETLIICPTVNEQRIIAGYLDKHTARIDKTIKLIENKINLLEEYKKSLIHHVVTGKVDVRGLPVRATRTQTGVEV